MCIEMRVYPDFVLKAYEEYFSDLKNGEEALSLEEFANMLGYTPGV